MNQIQKALDYAIKAHEGQFDKGGMPYVYHPIAVAMHMDTEEEKIVALLHDVIEDTGYTFNDIEKEFGYTIASDVYILTRAINVSYLDYIKIIKNFDNNVVKVKIADLNHNLDLSRISNPTEKDYKRLEKYKIALEILLS